jgi:hypothetical protein
MKIHPIFIALLFSYIANAQENNIRISLSSGEEISTSWLELHENPFFQKPYIILDSLNGKKLPITKLDSYAGWDQKQNFRTLKVNNLPFPAKYSFTELRFKMEEGAHVNIYYHTSTFIKNSRTHIRNDVRYRIREEKFKKVTYRNVAQEFKQINQSNSNFKKAQFLQRTQWVTTGIAIILISDFFRKNYNPNDGDFMKQSDRLQLIASGVLFTVPFALERPKRNKLIEALKGIRQ